MELVKGGLLCFLEWVRIDLWSKQNMFITFLELFLGNEILTVFGLCHFNASKLLLTTPPNSMITWPQTDAQL